MQRIGKLSQSSKKVDTTHQLHREEFDEAKDEGIRGGTRGIVHLQEHQNVANTSKGVGAARCVGREAIISLQIVGQHFALDCGSESSTAGVRLHVGRDVKFTRVHGSWCRRESRAVGEWETGADGGWGERNTWGVRLCAISEVFTLCD